MFYCWEAERAVSHKTTGVTVLGRKCTSDLNSDKHNGSSLNIWKVSCGLTCVYIAYTHGLSMLQFTSTLEVVCMCGEG